MRSKRSKLAEWRSALFQGTTFFGFAVIALVWSSAYLLLETQRESVKRNAVQNAGKLARAFEENIIRSVKEIDAALLFLRAAYEKDPENFAISDWVGGTHYRNDLALQLSVVDVNGFISQIAVFGAGGTVESMRKGVTPGTPNVADREHFAVHVGAEDDKLFLSKPIVGKTTGKTSLLLTRRLRRPDNSFAGIVAAALDPEYFGRFYQSIDVGRDGSILVVGLDGVIRAEAGYKSSMVGKSMAGTRPFIRVQTGPAGHFMGGGGIDGVKRLVA